MTEEPQYTPTAFDLLAVKVDSLFPKDKRLLEELGTMLIQRLTSAREQETSERKKAILVLQLNALISIVAAIEIWRRGFLLQTGVLLRNVVETIATAAVLDSDPKAYEAYKRGSLESSKSFTKLKKIWPNGGSILSKLSGDLSNEFTHLGKMYRSWHALTLDLSENDILGLRTMLLSIKLSLHSLDVLSEVTCYNFCPKPRYFKRVEANKYLYDPTIEGQQWIKSFLVEHVGEKGGSDGTTR